MNRPRHRLARTTALIAIAGIAALGFFDRDSSSSGSAARPGPPSAKDLAERLVAIDAALRSAIDDWRAERDPPTDPPPGQLIETARDLQATMRSLARRPNLAAKAIARLRPRLAAAVRRMTGAARELRRLSGAAGRRSCAPGRPGRLPSL